MYSQSGHVFRFEFRAIAVSELRMRARKALPQSHDRVAVYNENLMQAQIELVPLKDMVSVICASFRAS